MYVFGKVQFRPDLPQNVSNSKVFYCLAILVWTPRLYRNYFDGPHNDCTLVIKINDIMIYDNISSLFT